jgi:hypothetical protein
MNKRLVLFYTAAILAASASPTFAAGWAPTTNFATWYFGAIAVLAGVVVSGVGFQMATQRHGWQEIVGQLSGTVVGVGVMVLAAPLIVIWGLNAAGGAVLPHVIHVLR